MDENLFFQLIKEAEKNQSKRIVIKTELPAIRGYASLVIYLRCANGLWEVSNSEGTCAVMSYHEVVDYIFDFPEIVFRKCFIE